MSEYMIVNKQSLLDIANELRMVAGLGEVKLAFPEDFISTIRSLSGTNPDPTPTPEGQQLAFSSGSNFGHAGFAAVGDFNGTDYSATWSFTPTSNATRAVFTFNWANKTSEGGPGIGYNEAITMAFTINELEVTVNYSLPDEVSATEYSPFSVIFPSIELQAGFTYTITAKEVSTSTTNTAKMFKQAGNTVELTI